jgi:hypothetical protein
MYIVKMPQAFGFLECKKKYKKERSFSDSVTIKNVDFHGREKFPTRIEVVFSYQDDDISLLLQKDDDSTRLLSEDLFHTSKILPSGLFKDKERDVSRDNK